MRKNKNRYMMALKTAVASGECETVEQLFEKSWLKDPEEMKLLLVDAIKRKQYDIVKLFVKYDPKLKRNYDVTSRDYLLLYAVEIDDENWIKLLVKKGASLKVINDEKETPVHIAAKNAKKHMHSTLRFLLETRFQSKCENLVDNDGLSYLHAACICGSFKVVETLTKNGADVNQAVKTGSMKGYTPLHLAIIWNRSKVTDYLLNNGSDVHLKTGDGDTPLDLAFINKYVRIMSIILKFFKKDTKNIVGSGGLSYFHLVSTTNEIEILKAFLNQGVEVNMCCMDANSDYFQYTALHMAAESGCMNTVKLLLDSNADITAKNSDGETAFHLAYKQNHMKVMDLIMTAHKQNGFPNPSDSFGFSHFHIVCTKDKPDIINGFLKNGTSVDLAIGNESKEWPGFTPLHIAVECHLIGNIKIFLEQRADVNAKNAEGSTPLHLACQNSDLKLKKLNVSFISRMKTDNFSAAMNRYNQQVKIVKLLLKHHCDVNIRNKYGYTPLLETYNSKNFERLLKSFRNILTRNREETIVTLTKALADNHKLLVDSLLQFGAETKVIDDCGQNILHHLLNKDREFIKGEEDIAEKFIKDGVNVNCKDKSGITPLHKAIDKAHFNIAKLLITYNADVNSETLELHTPLHYLAFSFNRNIGQNDSAYLEIADILIKKGANINSQCATTEQTALHKLLSTGKGEIEFTTYAKRSRFSLAKNLMKYQSCNVNIQDSRGMTPLHYAVLHQDIEIVSILLGLGANVDITNNFGETAFSMCFMESVEHELLVSLFLFIHMKKLIALRYPLHKKNLMSYQKFEETYIPLNISRFYVRSLIELSENVVNLTTEKCNSEIDLLKSFQIDSYTTLFDILLKSANQMITHIKNESFVAIAESKHMRSVFPIYSYLVKLKYREGLRMSELVEPAKESFRCLMGKNVPDLCVSIIFDYLTEYDLKHLIRANFIV